MSTKRRMRRAHERDQDLAEPVFGWIMPWFEKALFEAEEKYTYADLWKIANDAWYKLAMDWNKKYPHRAKVDPMRFAKEYPQNEAELAA